MNLLAFSNLFLAMSGLEIGLLIGLIIVAVFAVGAFFVGGIFRQKSIDKELGTVQERRNKMIEEASLECKSLKKEAILEAKEQELQLRNEFEKECRDKKQELQKQEQRLVQKEEILDKKEDTLLKQNNAIEQQKKELVNKENELKKTQEKVNHQHELMVQELEKVAQLTKEEAKKQLSNEILDEARHDVALQVLSLIHI